MGVEMAIIYEIMLEAYKASFIGVMAHTRQDWAELFLSVFGSTLQWFMMGMLENTLKTVLK